MTAPSGALRAPVEIIIKVDDVEVDAYYRYLREAKVDMSRAAAASCTLVFDTVRLEDGTWAIQDAGVFAAWKRLLVEARFGDHTEEVMRGYIKEVKLDCPEDMSGATVTVTGQDESLLLDREHLRRTWSREDAQMTDGDLAQRIASDHGLSATADTGLANANLASDATPVRVLHDRAEANGFEMLVRAGTLYFRPPQLADAPQPTIAVYAGAATNCLRFAVRYDGHKPDKVRLVRATDQGAGGESQEFSPNLDLLGTDAATSENAGLAPFVWDMQSPSGATAAEAQARAQAKANENAWKLVAEGELDGALYGHVLLTHGTVRVDGVGTTYGGLYYVDEVHHVFSMNGYRQSFKLLRNATGDQQAGGGGDQLTGVR